jgi:UTP--glucose-1-phosphate uridylyltransferase
MVPPHVSCVFIRQAEALGLGHAVNCAARVVGDEPFAVVLADDMVANGNRGCLKQMVEVYDEWQCSVLATERVHPSETQSYGIVKADPVKERLAKLESIVEKPKPQDAPSNQAVIGRYILTPEIFSKLDQVRRGAGGEIQLTDGIAMLLNEQSVLSYEFEGKRYDCGSKLGFLMATVELGLQHEELREGFTQFLKNLKI